MKCKKQALAGRANLGTHLLDADWHSGGTCSARASWCPRPVPARHTSLRVVPEWGGSGRVPTRGEFR